MNHQRRPPPAGDDPALLAVAAALHRGAGWTFDRSRLPALRAGVTARAAAVGCPDPAGYAELLAGPGGPAELTALLEELAVGETHFFRNPPQVAALRDHVLPALVARASRTGRRLRVWSAGCSTGEEPYTVAILLRELLGAAPGWDIRVLATDVSERAVRLARAGRYGQRSVQLVAPEVLGRWFTRVPGRTGQLQVRDEVRDLVGVRRLNLVTDPPPFPAGGVDLVLCRNVTIYFSRDATAALMNRLHDCLRPGGYLLLGHAETLWRLSDRFHLEAVGEAFVYRRPAEPLAPTGPDRPTSPPVPRPARRPGERARGPRRPTAAGSVRRGPAAPPPAAAAADPPVGGAAVVGLLRSGRYAEASLAAGRVVAVQPLDVAPHYLRGLAETALGRDREAMDSLRKAVYLDPTSGLAHFLLGGALERLGHWRAAARSYRAAAAALLAHPPATDTPELDGRRPDELAVVCRLLAEQADTAAAVAG